MLHDNVRLHTAAHTVESRFLQLNFEVLKHPLCKPDLAPSITYFVH
jgi:hypothetical protein